MQSNETKNRRVRCPTARVAGPSRVGKPSATATMGTDAPDHFREPRNVTAGTVRDIGIYQRPVDPGRSRRYTPASPFVPKFNLAVLHAGLWIAEMQTHVPRAGDRTGQHTSSRTLEASVDDTNVCVPLVWWSRL